MNRFAAALTAAGVVSSALVAAQPVVATPPGMPVGPYRQFTPEPIQWGECDDTRLIAAGAECGFVTVPLDYHHPAGEKIDLAVSRVVHKTSDAEAQGPMLVNPGGPGSSGLVYAALGTFVPDGAADAYDWIGFDPRGVGSSEPALSCVPDFDGYNRPPYVPVNRQIHGAWLRRSRDYAKACESNGGALLHHMTTVEAALDVENIRKALGAEQINYYGFSYGTYLGQVYATLFPERLGRVIFDGSVDPTRVWYWSNIDQDFGFDRNMKVYFDWIARNDGVYHLGATGREVERRYYTEQAKLHRQPAGGIIGPAEFSDILLDAAYYVYRWENVAAAFAGWVHDGDWEPLRDLYGSPPFDDNQHAVYLAVVCTESTWIRNRYRYWFDNWVTHYRAPFGTWSNAWYNAPCLSWPTRTGPRIPVDGRGVDSALLIHETLDAATPYRGALEVRKRFPNSVLVEGVGGTTHSGSLSGVACTDDIITEYLRTGALPARLPGARSDVRCDPVPQPVPQPAPGEEADRRQAPAPGLRAELAAATLPR